MEEMCSKELKPHHIGYLVKNIAKAKKIFEEMGYVIEGESVYDNWRDVDICFLYNGGYRIELVSPRGTGSAVGELRKKIGNSPYHICYEVDDVNNTIKELGKKHFIIWQEPHEAVALGGRKVAFLVNGQVGMIELLEIEERI